VIGKDAATLKSFYGELFDWPLEEAEIPGYFFARPDGEEGLQGGIGADPSGGPGHVTFYVQVDDLQAALDKAELLGGRTVMPVSEIPNGPTIALLADPEGHTIGLVGTPTA
jgi:uncharacterized protein